MLIRAIPVVFTFFAVVADSGLFAGPQFSMLLLVKFLKNSFWQGGSHAMVEILFDKFSIIRHVVSMARVKLIIMIFIMILSVVSGGESNRDGCRTFIK
jgi:hypothetical protein